MKASPPGLWAIVQAVLNKVLRRKKKQQSSIYPLR